MMLNNKDGNMNFKHQGIYNFDLNQNLDKIIFPDGITHEIRLYSPDGTELQVDLFDENGKKIGVMNCLNTAEKIEQKEKEKKQYALKEEKAKTEALEKEKKDNIKREKNKIEAEKAYQTRFESYKKHLLSSGANPEILEMSAIKEIIMDIIKNGNSQNKMMGRSPISYENANSDGTFTIAGRMHGPNNDLIYEMSYAHDNNPEHFIELTKTIRKKGWEQVETNGGTYDYIPQQDLSTEQKIYINKKGDFVDKGKIERKRITKDEELAKMLDINENPEQEAKKRT